MALLFGSIQQASLSDAWLTIGTFDGVHIGHQEIIRGLAVGARAQGVPVVVLTFHPHPAAVVRQLGGPHLLTMPDERADYLSDVGADVVITACPVAEVQSQAIRMLAPFGRLCLFGGLPKGDGPVALDTNAIHYGNFTVTGSTGGSVQDYRIALRLVAGKRVDLTRIISDTFPLAELKRAYDTALAGPAGKVVLTAE